MSNHFLKFIVRIISIGLGVFLLIYFNISIFLSGFVIETIRRIIRLFVYGQKFRFSKHYLFWIVFQTIFYVISISITNLFYLDTFMNILIISFIISTLNVLLKSLRIEDGFFKIFKHHHHKHHHHHGHKHEKIVQEGDDDYYYAMGLQSVPGDVLRGWRREMSKKEFRESVESSGYKAVHGG